MPDNGHELSVDEQQVVDLLKSTGAPMDAIAIASQTRLQVQEVVTILNTLEERGLVSKARPEAVHERFATSAA
jgi:predicted Rossmann fold nucleotide-binding protein DprA/Smf involved in DNA uptake